MTRLQLICAASVVDIDSVIFRRGTFSRYCSKVHVLFEPAARCPKSIIEGQSYKGEFLELFPWKIAFVLIKYRDVLKSEP